VKKANGQIIAVNEVRQRQRRACLESVKQGVLVYAKQSQQ
jgi:hypothetical protein